MDAGAGLVQQANVVDDTILYPAGAATMRTINSLKVPGGGCMTFAGSIAAADMISLPVSSLGLTGPFHLAK
jgi:hypothetical protein